MAAIGEVIGQQKALTTIARLLDKGHSSQALLLRGSVGIGKFAIGLWTARRFLCENQQTGCGRCYSCRSIAGFNHPDFLLVFPFPNLPGEARRSTVFHFSDPQDSTARYSEDTAGEVNRFLEEKASDTYRVVSFAKKENIPAEVIRDLIKALGKRPLLGSRRVVLICDVEKMAFGATDLFLKTVEEPPPETLMILTTARPQALQPTLLSRTLQIPLIPVDDDAIGNYLKAQVSSPVSEFYIRFAMGSPGQALKAFEDEVIARRDALWKILRNYIEKPDLLQTVEALRKHTRRLDFDLARQDFSVLEKILRDIYVLKLGLDEKIINVDIQSEIAEAARSAPGPVVIHHWFRGLAKARRAHEISNISADTAFIGMFIEFEQAKLLAEQPEKENDVLHSRIQG